jgi:acetyl/propionyl-CoA carboxylase alpha subunit
MKYITTINSVEYAVEVLDERQIFVNNQAYQVDFHAVGDQLVYSLLIDGKSYEAYVYRDEEPWQVLFHGNLFTATVEDERERRLRNAFTGSTATDSEYQLKAPMPGLIVMVAVEEGQKIHKGDLLVVLESMKMQNELKSPREGVVSRLRVTQGESVEQRQLLLTVS